VKRTAGQRGFTLIELLVVAAIIVVMASALVGVGRRMLTRAQEKLAGSTLEIVVTAIEQYHGELDRFPMEYLNSQRVSVTSVFPQGPKVKLTDPFGLIEYLNDDLGLSRRIPAQTVTIPPTGFTPIECDQIAVSECLYYFLYQCPTSRRIVETIADSQKTSLDSDRKPRQAQYEYTNSAGQKVKMTITLIRLVDPWGSPFRYEFCRPTATFPSVPTMSFPRITSAGPDRKFDTADDLRSDE
jgi:prepilin-type N-terminal cleavage/methylation domain-containing protein